MQFRVLTIHSEVHAQDWRRQRGAPCSQSGLMMIAQCGPDLCPPWAPLPPHLTDPHLLLSPVCSHIDSYVTSQGDRGHNTRHTASGAASPHLNCLGGAGASLAAACVIVTSGESRDRAKHELLIHVACYLHWGRCARWKVLVRVQNMRRILKRNTFYNL